MTQRRQPIIASMATSVFAGALFIVSPASAETFASQSLSFRDVTATIEIVTTSGDETDVIIEQGTTFRSIRVVEEDGVVIVTGERWRDDETRNCCDDRIRRTFEPRKGRKLTTGAPVDEDLFATYPRIKVALPLKSDVEFIDARMKLDMDRLAGKLSLDACYVYGQVGDVDEAVIGIVDGSRLVVGNVAAGLEVDVSGDADLLVGDTSIVDIDIAGPGDVIVGDVTGLFDVSIAGSGLVRATYVDAPTTIRIAGSGGVAVKDGKADSMRAIIDGSGGIFFNGEASQPDLRLYGSSEVRMRSVAGRVTKYGGGTVYVGDEVFSDD